MKKLILVIILSFLLPSLTYPLEDWNPLGNFDSGLESRTGTYLEKDKWQDDRINIKSGREIKGYLNPAIKFI